jgi:hypothetical protein
LNARGARIKGERLPLANHFLHFGTPKRPFDPIATRYRRKISGFRHFSGRPVPMNPPRKKSMKSKKNLTRFSYRTAAFEGWRLCISRGGKTFMRYFPDKKFGGARRSLAAAERSLARLKPLLESAKRVGGKLSPTLVRKAEKLLEEAI